MTSIGERIRAARKAQGLSQPAVAREAGCSLATYKRYEQIADETPPEGYQYLWKIADLLQLDLRASPGVADPDNPLVRDATDLQLVAELHRRTAARAIVEQAETANGLGAPIEVRGMPVGTESDAGEVEPG